ncbi:MAG TPA: ATP-grasp domain-containing protein [Telluria sp.]
MTTKTNLQRVLLIGAGREGEDLLAEARAMGLRVLNINSKKSFKPAFLPLVEHAVLIDYEDLDALLPIARVLAQVYPFNSVISLSEDGLVAAAHVARALGLPGSSVDTVELLKDKARMRAHLARTAISPVVARVGNSGDDIATFFALHGKAIVKPVDGAGSFAVFTVAAPADAAAAAAGLAAAGIERFLMEEYLDGPEISVESFSFDGRHVIVALTDKVVLAHHVEGGHCVPSLLDSASAAAAGALTCTFLDAIGLRDGPAHTEIKLTARGPRIVESHNRVGGDRINELVRQAYGVSLKGLALGWAAGVSAALEAPPAPLRAAAIRYLVAEPGVVGAIGGLDAVRALPGFVELRIDVACGDTVRPVRCSSDRAGHVIATGATQAEAIARCEAMLACIRITTSPDAPSCN